MSVDKLRPEDWVIGGLALLLAVALLVFPHIHFSLFGWGFYVAAVTAGALVYFAAQARKSASSSSLA